MKKSTKVIICFLIITNILFIFNALNNKTKVAPQTFKVYQLKGENRDIKLSNGFITLYPNKDVIKGGTLEYLGVKQENITAYTESICFEKQGVINKLLVRSVSNGSGMKFPEELKLNPTLGSISGDKLFNKENFDIMKDNCYFLIQGTTKDGRTFEYKVKLQVNEI